MIKRILVIDDDEGIRKLFIRALEDSPYQVDTAELGAKGVKFQKEAKYELIFLDLNMPRMNGIEVLREIRMTDKEVPIYIITAFYKDYLRELTDIFYHEKGLKFEVINKPITINKICLIATETLEGSKVHQ
jgi:two-component system response regulator PilR (NtrC family)